MRYRIDRYFVTSSWWALTYYESSTLALKVKAGRFNKIKIKVVRILLDIVISPKPLLGQPINSSRILWKYYVGPSCLRDWLLHF